MAWGLIHYYDIEDEISENMQKLRKQSRGKGLKATKAIALRLALQEVKTLEEYEVIRKEIEAYVPLTLKQKKQVALERLLKGKV